MVPSSVITVSASLPAISATNCFDAKSVRAFWPMVLQFGHQNRLTEFLSLYSSVIAIASDVALKLLTCTRQGSNLQPYDPKATRRHFIRLLFRWSFSRMPIRKLHKRPVKLEHTKIFRSGVTAPSYTDEIDECWFATNIQGRALEFGFALAAAGGGITEVVLQIGLDGLPLILGNIAGAIREKKN